MECSICYTRPCEDVRFVHRKRNEPCETQHPLCRYCIRNYIEHIVRHSLWWLDSEMAEIECPFCRQVIHLQRTLSQDVLRDDAAAAETGDLCPEYASLMLQALLNDARERLSARKKNVRGAERRRWTRSVFHSFMQADMRHSAAVSEVLRALHTCIGRMSSEGVDANCEYRDLHNVNVSLDAERERVFELLIRR
jgi:hypothetical protein